MVGGRRLVLTLCTLALLSLSGCSWGYEGGGGYLYLEAGRQDCAPSEAVHAWDTPTPETWTPTPEPVIVCEGVVAVGAGYTLRVRDVPGGVVIGALDSGTPIQAVEVSADGRWFRIAEPLAGWVAGEWVMCG